MVRSETVGVISPGDMGHVVAEVLVQRGFRVVTALDGRSQTSCSRAERANMVNLGSLKNVIGEADYIISILPPENALTLVDKTIRLLELNSKVQVFADCNAVSPETTLKMQTEFKNKTTKFVKIGIVGPPPREGVVTRFYASGESAGMLDFLDGQGISYRNIGSDITSAAALKMCYAGLNKGTMTLQTAMLVAAELLGVRKEFEEEIRTTQQFHWDMMLKRMPFYAADSGRWAGEMDQISETLRYAGLTENLHKGAGDIFRLLNQTPLAQETRESLDKTRTLSETIKIYAQTANKLKK